MNRCLPTAIIFMALSMLFSINVIAEVDSVVLGTNNEAPKTNNLSQSKAEVELKYIYDFGEVFDASDDLGTLKTTLEQIKRDYNVNCIIVSVDNNTTVSPQETVSELFKKWNVGEAQQENILMLIFKEHIDSDDKKSYPSYVFAGKNLEKTFTSKVCKVIRFRLALSSNSEGAFDRINQIVDNSFIPLIKGEISPEQYIEESNQNMKRAVILVGPVIIMLLWFLFYMRLWSYGRSPAAQGYREKFNSD